MFPALLCWREQSMGALSMCETLADQCVGVRASTSRGRDCPKANIFGASAWLEGERQACDDERDLLAHACDVLVQPALLVLETPRER
jgi:hypothetical protein